MSVKFEIELKGTTPLLMHMDDVELADAVKAWQDDPKNKSISKAGDDRTPAWRWQDCLYHDGEHVAMPAFNLLKSLTVAASIVKVQRQTTLKKYIAGGFFIDEEFAAFFVNGKQLKMADIRAMREKSFAEQAQAVKPLGFTLFTKRATIGQSKHVRVRPRFDNWSVRFSATAVAKEITKERLAMVLECCGANGLCDWRPSSKSPGPFGVFEAKILK